MKQTHNDRGANIRRNLRRWRKPLLIAGAGWIFLLLVVSTGAVIYAHEHHWSLRRIRVLGENCGAAMAFILAIAVMTVLVIADRSKRD